MKIRHYDVTEGELKRLIQTNTINRFIAQESYTDKLRFCLVGINSVDGIAYKMRQSRVNELRYWRLDNLVKFLKTTGNKASVEVQFNEQR